MNKGNVLSLPIGAGLAIGLLVLAQSTVGWTNVLAPWREVEPDRLLVPAAKLWRCLGRALLNWGVGPAALRRYPSCLPGWTCCRYDGRPGGELTSVLPIHGLAGSCGAGVPAFLHGSGVDHGLALAAGIDPHLFPLSATSVPGVPGQPLPVKASKALR